MRPGETPDDDARREERRTKAIKLRRAGWSYREIAAELKVHPSTAQEDVRAVLREVRREVTEEAKELERQRYDRYLRAADASIIGNTSVCEACGRSDLKAIEAAVKISKARRELDGWDAPAKHEVKTTNIDPNEDPRQVRAKLLEAVAEIDKQLGEPKEVH